MLQWWGLEESDYKECSGGGGIVTKNAWRPTSWFCDSLSAKPNKVSLPSTTVLSGALLSERHPPGLACPELPYNPFRSCSAMALWFCKRTNRSWFWNLQEACLFIWASRNPTAKPHTRGEKETQSGFDFIRLFCVWKSSKNRNYPSSSWHLGLIYHGLWYITMTKFYSKNHQNMLSYYSQPPG